LNKAKPNVYFKQRKTGGLAITPVVPLTKINEKLIYSVLAEYSK
jgi:ribosome-interacting GTPase 1